MAEKIRGESVVAFSFFGFFSRFLFFAYWICKCCQKIGKEREEFVMEMYFKLSELTKLEQQMYYNCIYLFLMEANIQHPEFSAWYSGLFTDDLRLKPEYEIVICEKEYEIAGVTILKSTKEEAKICTVYVAEQYRHNGLGRRLMELSLEWLENEKPVMMLDKSKEPDFAGILKHFGFVFQEENYGLHNPGKIELIYNGKN